MNTILGLYKRRSKAVDVMKRMIDRGEYSSGFNIQKVKIRRTKEHV